jgi:hypothetical protein
MTQSTPTIDALLTLLLIILSVQPLLTHFLWVIRSTLLWTSWPLVRDALRDLSSSGPDQPPRPVTMFLTSDAISWYSGSFLDISWYIYIILYIICMYTYIYIYIIIYLYICDYICIIPSVYTLTPQLYTTRGAPWPFGTGRTRTRPKRPLTETPWPEEISAGRFWFSSMIYIREMVTQDHKKLFFSDKL